MIAPETIAEIRSRVSLVDVVSETVSLKRQGSALVGLCPFHGERTPSFNVRPDDNFYHCFGCGASGNVITYVMQIRGLSFPEAVEELAGRAGIAIKKIGGGQTNRKGPDKFALYDLNAKASAFFRAALMRSEDKVKEYVRARKLSVKAIDAFGVGYAANEWHELCDYLLSKGAPEDLIVSAGLARRNPRGELYDVFRGRLMFPIAIDRKHIAGFGGRVIPALFPAAEGQKLPKYLNSSESEIYQKNKILYALPQAFTAIREKRSLYLVEGYLDVIGLWQGGVRNAVATCGTALSTEHVRRIARVSPNVVVLFDGDNAGRAAAAKCFELFLNSRVSANAVFLAEGQDPDSLAAEHGEHTEQYLMDLPRVSLLRCFIEELCLEHGSSLQELSPAAKGALAERLSQTLVKVQQRLERHELIKEAAFILRVDENLLEQTVDESQGAAARPAPPSVSSEGHSEADALRRKRIDELPAVDRQFLLTVMGERQRFCERALREPLFFELLDPVTFTFVQGLQAVVSLGEPDHERTRIRELLSSFGASWIAHWKEAHRIVSDPAVRLDIQFNECLQALKRIKVEREIASLRHELSACSAEKRREELSRQVVELGRRREGL
jgi:DNA primase